MKKYFFLLLFISFSFPLFAQETILYVGPKSIKCNDKLDVMCMQVKESEEAGYQPFAYPIEGFTFEEGYDYKLSVYKGVQDNPPTDRPAVYYKLKKIISKKIPQVTLQIANRMSTCEDTKIFNCLLYREKGENEWHNLYGKIKGFKYKAGYDYELLVSKKLNANNGGGNTYEYSLIKTISKRATMIISSKNITALDQKKFVLENYRDEKGEFQQAGGSPKPIILSFKLDENLAYGNDGCNELSSKIEINNSAISFGPIMATKMFCPNMSMDRIVQTNLAKVNKYKINMGVLRLYEDDIMLFEYYRLMEDLSVPKK